VKSIIFRENQIVFQRNKPVSKDTNPETFWNNFDKIISITKLKLENLKWGPDYIMTSNFNLRIQKQAWFHCDVKLSQTCPIRSHKRAQFYKETTLSFHLMHVYNFVRVSGGTESDMFGRVWHHNGIKLVFGFSSWNLTS
jgi:hypothetical protein